jgi:hypothetical protein
VGYFAGREVAQLFKSFPPIWTELELTINSDGSIRHVLLSHSVFPSNTLFSQEKAVSNELVEARYTVRAGYNGGLKQLQRWQDFGWDLASKNRVGPTNGNPWGMRNPAKTLGMKVLQECPQGYTCEEVLP